MGSRDVIAPAAGRGGMQGNDQQRVERSGSKDGNDNRGRRRRGQQQQGVVEPAVRRLGTINEQLGGAADGDGGLGSRQEGSTKAGSQGGQQPGGEQLRAAAAGAAGQEHWVQLKGRQRGRGGSGNKGDAEGDANWSEQQLNSFQVAAHTRRLPCAHVCTFADEDVRGLGLSDIVRGRYFVSKHMTEIGKLGGTGSEGWFLRVNESEDESDVLKALLMAVNKVRKKDRKEALSKEKFAGQFKRGEDGTFADEDVTGLGLSTGEHKKFFQSKHAKDSGKLGGETIFGTTKKPGPKISAKFYGNGGWLISLNPRNNAFIVLNALDSFANMKALGRLHVTAPGWRASGKSRCSMVKVMKDSMLDGIDATGWPSGTSETVAVIQLYQDRELVHKFCRILGKKKGSGEVVTKWERWV
jgi:hypothetical protein